MMAGLRRRWAALRQHYWLALGIDVAVIVVILWAVHAWQTRDLPLDEPAPATVLASLDGRPNQQATRPGAVGVVYFFAPWCSICRHSISNLDALVESGSLAWATTIALDYRDEREVRQFIEETGVSLPVLMGHAGTAQDWGIRGFPTYYVINASGQISSRSVGYSTWLGLKARTGLAAE